MEMEGLLTFIVLLVAIFDRVSAVFISKPPNLLYFTPPEPLVLNWTFTKPYQYRVELYEYLEDWKTWDLIFKSLVWLKQYNYYKYGDRLKFTMEPQSTITYNYSKPEDAGRKRFWLYSYDESGGYVFEEALTQFVVLEANSTSTVRESSVYSVQKDSPTIYSTGKLEANNSEIRTSTGTSNSPSAFFAEEISLASSHTLYYTSTKSSEAISPTHSYISYQTNIKFLEAESTEPTDKSHNTSKGTKFEEIESHVPHSTSIPNMQISSTYIFTPTIFPQLETSSTTKELQFGSQYIITSQLASSTAYYTTSHLLYKSPSTSVDIWQTSKKTLQLSQGYVTTELSTVSNRAATIHSLTLLHHISSKYESSSLTTSRLNRSNLLSMQNMTLSSEASTVDYISNHMSPIPFNSKTPHHNVVTTNILEDALTTTMRGALLSGALFSGALSTAVQQSWRAHTIPNSSMASSAIQPKIDKSGAGKTSSNKMSWTIALSVGIPIGFVAFFLITGWLYVTNYKKICKVIPAIEEGEISENNKGTVSLKYIAESDEQ